MHAIVFFRIAVLFLLAAGIGGAVFLRLPRFGRLPQGERLERIKRSPNYRNGEFRNRETTALLTSGKSRLCTMTEFLFRRREGVRPDTPVPVIRTDLRSLPADTNIWVWFGHSSFLIQAGGKRILVDPVFHGAAPVPFVNEPFAGTDAYGPDDMPDIDYLVITHDHWDHLDHATVTALRERIGTVICPLGVGAHFEYWGFDPERIVELDWDESDTPEPGFTVYCLTARHFSGRGLRSNRTLWASFLLETPAGRIFIGGDGGYGRHVAAIGRRFPQIDLAVLENGQYDENWRYIHTMPRDQARFARELGAREILTVHHSKYALARHRWNEPLENERELCNTEHLPVRQPQIGEIVPIGKPESLR